MKFIKDYKEGDRVFDIYLCKHKQSAVTKNGKPYETVILQDKTGTVDGKIWDPNSAGIDDFDSLDYIEVYGDVTCFQGANQINIKRIRLCREGEYEPANYLPVSKKDIPVMYQELLSYINSMENEWLRRVSGCGKEEDGNENYCDRWRWLYWRELCASYAETASGGSGRLSGCADVCGESGDVGRCYET